MSAFQEIDLLADGGNLPQNGWTDQGAKFFNQTNTASGWQTFRLGTSTSDLWSGHDIKIDFTSTSGQYDVIDGDNPGGGSNHPSHFFVGSSDPTGPLTATTISLVNSTDYLYLNQDANITGNWVKLDLTGPSTAGGGSGGSGPSQPSTTTKVFSNFW